jgi:hypothetical protein
MQHSTNTSQITNNNFGGATIGDNNVPFNQEEQTERNLPSELRHRPKIPRTPNRTER